MTEQAPKAFRSDGDGLIVEQPDSLTQEEIDNFRAYYARTKGQSLPGFEFLLANRSDALKRFRASVRATSAPQFRSKMLPVVLQHFHQYIINGYVEGIRYQMNLSRAAGATKGEILDVIVLAFLRGNAFGVNRVAEAIGDAFDTYEEVGIEDRWPEGWAHEPLAFKSGIDFTTPDFTDADRQALFDWYDALTGEIPQHIQYMAKNNPDLLKTYRNRYEHATKAIPKQHVPYLLLNSSVSRGLISGVRENVLLCKAFGVERQRVLDVTGWATFHFSGIEALGPLNEGIADIMDAWRD